jgi:hypothetical protein
MDVIHGHCCKIVLTAGGTGGVVGERIGKYENDA